VLAGSARERAPAGGREMDTINHPPRGGTLEGISFSGIRLRHL
jgi:hypothetical protein